MTRHPDIDAPVGDYVYEPPYLEMRLRMLLTGSAGPSEREWAGALTRLLEHLELHPVPDQSPTSGTDATRMTAPVNADEFASGLAEEIRLLDLHDDYVPLVMASDTPLVSRLTGRILDWTEIREDGFVDLVRHDDGTRDFAVDAVLHFEDPDGPATLALTLFGTDRNGTVEWSSADLSTRDAPEIERSDMADAVIRIMNGMQVEDLREASDSDLADMIPAEASVIIDIRRDRIVTTGMEDLHAFVCGVTIVTSAADGAVMIPCIVHGHFDDGTPKVTAVSLGL